MKEINNLKGAQTVFPDAIKLKLRIDAPTTASIVRKLIPDSVTIIYCKISKNYVSLIYSKQAKECCYPDVTLPNQTVRSSDGKFWLTIHSENDFVGLTASFCPSCYPKFTRSLEGCGYGEVQILENYQDAGMGFILFVLNELPSSRDNLFQELQSYLDCCVAGNAPVELVHLGVGEEK